MNGWMGGSLVLFFLLLRSTTTIVDKDGMIQ